MGSGFGSMIFQKSGRGVALSGRLTYNNMLWNAVPPPRDVSGNPIGTALYLPSSDMGWLYESITGYVSYTLRQAPCTGTNNVIFIRENYTYHDGAGTAHYIGGSALDKDCQGTPHSFASMMASDGSGYSLKILSRGKRRF